MEAHVFLLELVLILFSARVVGELFGYFRIPSVLGELVAGLLIGPSVFGLVEPNSFIHLLSQIGIILLLFEVGMETDVERLTSAGKRATLVAISGVVLPFFLGFLASYYLFHLSLLVSLFIGSTLTATSIGITLRVLKDLRKNTTDEAQVILGAAVLDDIIGIILLAMLYEFAVNGSVNMWNAVKVLACVTLFFLLAPLAAKAVSALIQKWEEKSTIPGVLPTAVVSLILLFAWITSMLGAPELLGGFAAGIAMSKRFFVPFASFLRKTPAFSHRIKEQMKSIIHLFTPIFFVTVGLSLDLQSVEWTSSFMWIFTLSIFALAVIGKLLSGCILFQEKYPSRFLIGTAMVPRGEVGLIFASIGLTTKVLGEDLYAALILVIALTTLLPPLALRKLARKIKA